MAKAKEDNAAETPAVEKAGPVVVTETPAVEKRFRVTWKDHNGTFTARDESEAWAMFCDSIKTYPSPKCSKTIEAV